MSSFQFKTREFNRRHTKEMNLTLDLKSQEAQEVSVNELDSEQTNSWSRVSDRISTVTAHSAGAIGRELFWSNSLGLSCVKSLRCSLLGGCPIFAVIFLGISGWYAQYEQY